MYTNPYRLKPGEKLTAQQLLDRYLDWSDYRNDTKAWEKKDTCDNDLFKGHLCCEDHFKYSHEHDDFLRYFVHFDMMTYADVSFTRDLLCGFIRRNHLQYDLERLARNLDIDVVACKELLRD